MSGALDYADKWRAGALGVNYDYKGTCTVVTGKEIMQRIAALEAEVARLRLADEGQRNALAKDEQRFKDYDREVARLLDSLYQQNDLINKLKLLRDNVRIEGIRLGLEAAASYLLDNADNPFWAADITALRPEDIAKEAQRGD